jgi:hypothetical protein
LLAAGLASLTVLAAGCGGGSRSPSVASLGTTTPSNGPSKSSLAFAPPPGGIRIGASISRDVGPAGVKYTACMRSHGVPNFPDPDSHGTITITISASLNPNAPMFQQAEADCRQLLPPGKTLNQAQQKRMKDRLLAYAACMRSHGFPHYPDPTFGSGGAVSNGVGRNDGMNPNSPIFQAARKACRSA